MIQIHTKKKKKKNEEQNWEPTELLKIPFACFYYLIGPLDCKLPKIDVIMEAFDTNSKKLAVHII